MFRSIARILDVSDVIGLAGLVAVTAGAYLFDPRLALFVVGAFLILLAVARAAPRTGE